MHRAALLVAACLLGRAAAADDVVFCPGSGNPSIQNVSISAKQSPSGEYILKKGTQVELELNFMPEEDAEQLVNAVHAKIGEAQLPFLGIQGTSACNDISLPDGEKVNCPLTAGREYTYKNSFAVYKVYPTVPVKVHWQLDDQSGSVVCFEVRARIVA